MRKTFLGSLATMPACTIWSYTQSYINLKLSYVTQVLHLTSRMSALFLDNLSLLQSMKLLYQWTSNKAWLSFTVAKMTQFWARFKQNDLQNRAIREILAKSYRIAPQNCAELVAKLLLRIPLYVDFLILIPLCSMIMSIHCFIGIFVGPLNTNCIKYQANQKWVKLEL